MQYTSYMYQSKTLKHFFYTIKFQELFKKHVEIPNIFLVETYYTEKISNKHYWRRSLK